MDDGRTQVNAENRILYVDSDDETLDSRESDDDTDDLYTASDYSTMWAWGLAALGLLLIAGGNYVQRYWSFNANTTSTHVFYPPGLDAALDATAYAIFGVALCIMFQQIRTYLSSLAVVAGITGFVALVVGYGVEAYYIFYVPTSFPSWATHVENFTSLAAYSLLAGGAIVAFVTLWLNYRHSNLGVDDGSEDDLEDAEETSDDVSMSTEKELRASDAPDGSNKT